MAENTVKNTGDSIWAAILFDSKYEKYEHSKAFRRFEML